MGAQFSQFFPPSATFTDDSIKPQNGKVFLITGAYSGIGLEVARVVYNKGGKVYIAGRSQEKARKAMSNIEQSAAEGGSLHFLPLDLDDLGSIKASVDAFKRMEIKLDVLWNNAGVSQPPLGSQSKQGLELQLATNCFGPFLLTQLLLPLLKAASTDKSSSARVIWLSSQVMELSAPKGGVVMSKVKNPPKDQTYNYTMSKTGNYFLACEFARRYGASNGIISVSLNPGAADTQLFRHTPWIRYLAWPLLYAPSLAAYTELYAGFFTDIDLEHNGSYVIPWGRLSGSIRKDLIEATKPKDEGGSGTATDFWNYYEEVTSQYA